MRQLKILSNVLLCFRHFLLIFITTQATTFFERSAVIFYWNAAWRPYSTRGNICRRKSIVLWQNGMPLTYFEVIIVHYLIYLVGVLLFLARSSSDVSWGGKFVVCVSIFKDFLFYLRYPRLTENTVRCRYSAVNFPQVITIDTPYHGYAMRKILPLCIKTVTCKSKGFLCLFGHNSRIHCFWLKNLNLFS